MQYCIVVAIIHFFLINYLFIYFTLKEIEIIFKQNNHLMNKFEYHIYLFMQLHEITYLQLCMIKKYKLF